MTAERVRQWQTRPGRCMEPSVASRFSNGAAEYTSHAYGHGRKSKHAELAASLLALPAVMDTEVLVVRSSFFEHGRTADNVRRAGAESEVPMHAMCPPHSAPRSPRRRGCRSRELPKSSVNATPRWASQCRCSPCRRGPQRTSAPQSLLHVQPRQAVGLSREQRWTLNL